MELNTSRSIEVRVLATKSCVLSQVDSYQLYYNMLRPPQIHRWCESCFRWNLRRIKCRTNIREHSATRAPGGCYSSFVVTEECVFKPGCYVIECDILYCDWECFGFTTTLELAGRQKDFDFSEDLSILISIKSRRQRFRFQMNSPGENQKVRELSQLWWLGYLH